MQGYSVKQNGDGSVVVSGTMNSDYLLEGKTKVLTMFNSGDGGRQVLSVYFSPQERTQIDGAIGYGSEFELVIRRKPDLSKVQL
jgi:hypothetical protein